MSTPRTVVANIALSLDGRIAGPGGEYDMSWIVPHAVTDGARAHMVAVTAPATTALPGRKNYEGFGGFWPSVADDENADQNDRTQRRALPAVRPGPRRHSCVTAHAAPRRGTGRGLSPSV